VYRVINYYFNWSELQWFLLLCC